MHLHGGIDNLPGDVIDFHVLLTFQGDGFTTEDAEVHRGLKCGSLCSSGSSVVKCLLVVIGAQYRDDELRIIAIKLRQIGHKVVPREFSLVKLVVENGRLAEAFCKNGGHLSVG